MRLIPYLYFDGRSEEAIEFYRKAIGAEVKMLLRFKDAPPSAANPITPGIENKVMHATLQIGQSEVHVSDGHCQSKMKFDGFGLTLNASDAAAAEKLFNALGEGGTVTMPLSKTFFSPAFGMLKDRFGITWMVLVESTGNAAS